MKVDTHMHTAEYSPDSFLPIAEAVARAREMGIDGLCVTDHDTLGARDAIERWRRDLNFPLFLGCEVLTADGDVVCFGLDKAPEPGAVSAAELIKHVRACGGCTVAAHPFRNNNRGLEGLISTVEGLDGVECFNGSTDPSANLHALDLAKKARRALLGAADAHYRQRLGLFVTEFDGWLRDEGDLIAAVRSGACRPLAWNGGGFVPAEEFCRAQLKEKRR
ncbi:MAG: PHP domain-containing protein [Pyramidobacter sp.]